MPGLPPAAAAVAGGAALAAVLGVGAARYAKRAPAGAADGATAAYRAAIAAQSPALCAAVDALAAGLGRADLAEAVAARAAAVCAACAHPTPGAARRISQWNREIERALEAACAAHTPDVDAFRRQEHVRLDVLPEIVRHLDTLLHNHLLRGSA